MKLKRIYGVVTDENNDEYLVPLKLDDIKLILNDFGKKDSEEEWDAGSKQTGTCRLPKYKTGKQIRV